MSQVAKDGMTDVYVECLVPASARTCTNAGGDASVCLALHRVEWLRTLESVDSQRVLCHFRAPDAESVRVALRRMQIGVAALWIGAIPDPLDVD